MTFPRYGKSQSIPWFQTTNQSARYITITFDYISYNIHVYIYILYYILYIYILYSHDITIVSWRSPDLRPAIWGSPAQGAPEAQEVFGHFQVLERLARWQEMIGIYPLVIEHNYWKLPFIFIYPSKIVIFYSYVSLPEGTLQDGNEHMDFWTWHQENPWSFVGYFSEQMGLWWSPTLQ